MKTKMSALLQWRGDILNAPGIIWLIRRSDKHADEIMCDSGAALNAEDGEDYSAWPVARFPDNSELEFTSDNITDESVRTAIYEHLGC